MGLFVPVLTAQTLPPDGSAPSTHPHVGINVGVIDGSTHPELIPDLTAYRLVFVSMADSADNSSADKMGHKAHIGKMQFKNADQQSFVTLMQTFRTQYDDLVQKYNQEAKAALEAGSTPDVSSFLKRRDALVQGILDRLKLALSAEGLSRLDAFVSSEKQHMKIQPTANTSSQ
jgi:hypothetical protein